MKHVSNGMCLYCKTIIDRYPGFHTDLKNWFYTIQFKNHDAHVSCAGRGAVDQNMLHERGATRALWGASSHNYNAALDLFQMKDGQYSLDKDWFQVVVGANLRPWIKWYGLPGAEFPERPHIEVANWRELVKNGTLKLVE